MEEWLGKDGFHTAEVSSARLTGSLKGEWGHWDASSPWMAQARLRAATWGSRVGLLSQEASSLPPVIVQQLTILPPLTSTQYLFSLMASCFKIHHIHLLVVVFPLHCWAVPLHIFSQIRFLGTWSRFSHFLCSSCSWHVRFLASLLPSFLFQKHCCSSWNAFFLLHLNKGLPTCLGNYGFPPPGPVWGRNFHSRG